MKKQNLFLVGLFCLVSFNLAGQSKYNDLKANQLLGAVKEVNTIRKLHGGVDWGDSDSKWSTQFDNHGYITKSEDYIYQWNANYTQCSCEVPREKGEWYYNIYKFNVNTANNMYKYEGGFTQYQGTDKEIKGTGPSNMDYQFDTSGRLLTVKQYADMLLNLSMKSCDSQTYSYKGIERLPYKVLNEMSDGGESWGIEFLIKYENIDSHGNWLRRKLYNIENNKQFVEEIRTITYYSEINNSSIQSSIQRDKTSYGKSDTNDPIDAFLGKGNLKIPNNGDFVASAPSTVVAGEQFRLNYTIGIGNVDNFKAPSLNNFNVLMGPSKSTSTEVIKGTVTSKSSITYTFVLQAEKTGNFTIPSAIVESKGKTYTSNTVTIKVTSK